MIEAEFSFSSNGGAERWCASLMKKMDEKDFEFQDLGRRCMLYLYEITPFRGRVNKAVALRDSYYLENGKYWWSINSSQLQLFRWLDFGTPAHGASSAPSLRFPETREGMGDAWYNKAWVRGIAPHFMSSKLRDFMFYSWRGGSPIIGELYD